MIDLLEVTLFDCRTVKMTHVKERYSRTNMIQSVQQKPCEQILEERHRSVKNIGCIKHIGKNHTKKGLPKMVLVMLNSPFDNMYFLNKW